MTFPSVEQVRHKNSQTDEELEFIFGRRSELRADRGDGGALSQGDRPSEPPAALICLRLWANTWA